MAFNDKINDNIDEMFSEKKNKSKIILDKAIRRGIFSSSRGKPGDIVKRLSDEEREELSNLKSEDLKSHDNFARWG